MRIFWTRRARMRTQATLTTTPVARPRSSVTALASVAQTAHTATRRSGLTKSPWSVTRWRTTAPLVARIRLGLDVTRSWFYLTKIQNRRRILNINYFPRGPTQNIIPVPTPVAFVSSSLKFYLIDQIIFHQFQIVINHETKLNLFLHHIKLPSNSLKLQHQHIFVF